MAKGFQTFCGDDILVTAGMTNPCFSFFCTSFFRTSLHGSVRSNYHSLCRLCVNNEFLIIICGTIFWWQLKFDECMFSTSCPSFTPNTHFHTLSLLKRCFDHPWNVTSNLCMYSMGVYGGLFMWIICYTSLINDTSK